MKHIDSVHEGIKPFKCKECDYEAAHKSSLKKHTESVHKGIKRFKSNMNEDCDGVNNPVKMELSEQILVDVDPLLIHQIKEEFLEENEAAPIQDLTEVYIKQEEFDASGYQDEQRNGIVVQEIKKEFVLGE